MSKFAFCRSARPGLAQISAAAVAGGMLLASSATAIELSDTLQLHGFASQAYVETSANRYFGPSDSGSFQFRELGVNLSWRALSKLQFSAQVGSRRAGWTDQPAPRIDYAFADVTALSGEAGLAGARVGRYRLPLGFYNLTRDVANTRPSIFLPESIYSDQARQSYLALDGAEGYGEARTAAGDFYLQYGEGKIIVDEAAKASVTPTNSYAWRVLYELDGGLVRLAVSRINVNANVIDPAFTTPNPVLYYLHPKINVNSTLYSAQYNAENWSLTGEYFPDSQGGFSNLDAVFFGTPVTLPDTKVRGESFYLQGTYRLADDWEALLRYDVLYGNKEDRSGQKTATATSPAHRAFAKDMTVGLGWSVRPDTRIRAEWHHVNGTAWLSATENPALQDTRQYWDMFALQVSYSF